MNNMTQGSPLKHILKFAFPVWLGILFQQFYSVADTVIVGRFLGLNQLAGVGATSIFSNLVIWFFGGLCNGFCILLPELGRVKEDLPVGLGSW